MAKVIPIGEPVNGAERLAIAHLRDHLPDGYLLLHNFEVRRNHEHFEVDLAVLAPHAVYLVDVKGTRGAIDVYGPKWYPEGRQPFTSPLLKLRGHARSLKGIITESQPSRRELEGIFVDAVVLLTAPNAALNDPGGRDAGNVTTLEQNTGFFKDTSRIPGRFSTQIGPLHGLARKAIVGVSKPRSGPLQFGSWEVTERLGATDQYVEYRAVNSYARAGSVLLRAYQADPYAQEAERKAQRRLIANAFAALSAMPIHQGIVGARDFFPTEAEDLYILVTEDAPGRALRLHLDKPDLPLTLDQKLTLTKDLLGALEHAHRHGVVHRNLSPATVLVGSDGHARLTGFDLARAGKDRSYTIADEIADDLEPGYLAPEVYADASAATAGSDLFSIGLILYELFVSKRPFSGQTEMFDRSAEFSEKPSTLHGELPSSIDDWLQGLCEFDPGERPSATEALAGLRTLFSPAAAREGLSADAFIDRHLARFSGELRPLVDYLGQEETDWLEFKAGLIPPPDRKDANVADGQWAVVKAVVALANSAGGAVLLGVNDDGKPVPLADSDPKGYLEKDGWDMFARKVLDGALFRDGGWKTFKRGTWTLNVPVLRSQVVTKRATLDGAPIVVLLVKAASDEDLLLARCAKEGSTEEAYFVRRQGDVGVVDKLKAGAELDAWRRTRQIGSTYFEGLLDRIPDAAESDDKEAKDARDFSNLQSGDTLTSKFVVDKRLGKPGAFGVVYKVIDTFGDVSRAIKLILRDRHSKLERLKKEYRTLLHTPEHPNLVKVIDADLVPGGPPFIVFEFAEGLDVGEMIEAGSFSPEDTLDLARQVGAGLAHLHRHGTHHCDIKPRNLLWTNQGAKIIDFNVSVRSTNGNGQGGGSRRYLPPDLNTNNESRDEDLVDRDLYALGLTLYEALTRRYPWETTTPPAATQAPDPRELPGLSDLAPEFVAVLLKAIAPRRSERFGSAEELEAVLEGISQVRRPASPTSEGTIVPLGGGGQLPPNTNPFVSHLLTLYSQSRRSNAGTRGLDALSEQTYVSTALDRELAPAVLRGELRLVLISGNAGDGKTAFLQQLERRAAAEGAVLDSSVGNGCRFKLGGRRFWSNYDGSQDEGDETSDAVLRAFLAPFDGDDADRWPTDETRLIAINEGRLVDFLSGEAARFPLLAQLVSEGMVSGAIAHGVAVINLNLRSVVALPADGQGEAGEGSILARLLRRMTDPRLWAPCEGCDLAQQCYVHHNARTFQDATAGGKVIERLEALYRLTHLRGRLHITLRDLGSALAFMLAGTRDCAEIHALYDAGERDAIVQGFYFNSWMGGTGPNADRLLSLLREVDVGQASDPRLDRSLDFVSPTAEHSLFGFAQRGDYDRKVLRRLFDDLPREFGSDAGAYRARTHRAYVAMARRRAFFERRDAGWRRMLPYRTGELMIAQVSGQRSPDELLPEVLQAINRGEGLRDTERLGGSLALQVREVPGGTIRSYRLYPTECFSLEVPDAAARASFVEHLAAGLVLRYTSDAGNDAELPINLDVLEMLQRLNQGYRPSIEEERGYYLSLAMFKNVLGSAPYREVLLTTTGHDFFRIRRHDDERLELDQIASTADVASSGA